MSEGRTDKLQLKCDELVWREVGDELVVLELSTSTYLTLNGTAKLLWLALADGATIDQLAGCLSDRYRISPSQARSDAESFVTALDDRALIERDS